jgi:hypothetical protein
MYKFVRSTCVLAAWTAFTLSAQVASNSQTVQTTGIVGIADAQTAQLNLLNPGVLAPAVGVICKATVSFVDAGGAVLKSGVLTVAPGQSMSFALRSDVDLSLVSGGHREIRATISTPAILTPTAAGSAAQPGCKLIPTLEMFDTVSGRTLVVLGHAATIPAIATAAPQ